MVHPRRASFASLLLTLAAPPLFAQTAEQNDSSARAAARANALPLIPTRTLDFTTDEGSWISLDLSPDGGTIVFELLGDLYTLPAAGGSAARITSGQGYDMQPRYSTDGAEVVFVSDRDGSENMRQVGDFQIAMLDRETGRTFVRVPDPGCTPFTGWTPTGLHGPGPSLDRLPARARGDADGGLPGHPRRPPPHLFHRCRPVGLPGSAATSSDGMGTVRLASTRSDEASSSTTSRWVTRWSPIRWRPRVRRAAPKSRMRTHRKRKLGTARISSLPKGRKRRRRTAARSTRRPASTWRSRCPRTGRGAPWYSAGRGCSRCGATK